ncbi:methyltransferase domain-containing protein [Bradyrhizobium genosp. P]|uniref:methyltransferase domain-containing protein n=1 Tax=Bradyrhizobium genosp. P TaxID=83641 RepID=UPI003CEC7E13
MRRHVKKPNIRVITTNAPPSELGDSGIEVSPLRFRVISVQDLTAEVLKRSGIKRGMRVLDLGCGSGDASLLIAKMVGPSGLVVGVDESAQAIDEIER